MSQIFSIWLVPFYMSVVDFTTLLDLVTESPDVDNCQKLYYIRKQEDLYQSSQLIKFFVPHLGYPMVLGLRLFATLLCALGVSALWPVMWAEDRGIPPGKVLRKGNLVLDMDCKIPDLNEKR